MYIELALWKLLGSQWVKIWCGLFCTNKKASKNRQLCIFFSLLAQCWLLSFACSAPQGIPLSEWLSRFWAHQLFLKYISRDALVAMCWRMCYPDVYVRRLLGDVAQLKNSRKNEDCPSQYLLMHEKVTMLPKARNEIVPHLITYNTV